MRSSKSFEVPVGSQATVGSTMWGIAEAVGCGGLIAYPAGGIANSRGPISCR
jgi:hypothetical protein